MCEPPVRLTRREFARALRLGLGRARQDVRRHGIDGREDLLVAACLRSGTRDRQLEGCLATWLFAVAREANALPVVRRAVISRAARPLRRGADAGQVATILARFHETGDRAAARALLRMVDVNVPDDVHGAAEAIWMLGERGWLHVARSFGRRWDQARTADLDWLCHLAERHVGRRRHLDALRTRARREPALRPFLAAVEAHADASPDATRTTDAAFDASLDAHERLVRSRGGLTRTFQWHRLATPADRAAAWRLLVEETAPRMLRRRLIAWRGGAPEFHPRLAELTRHPDRLVRIRARAILETVETPEVRDLALALLRERPLRAVAEGALTLLVRTAKDDDVAVIAAAFPPRASRDMRNSWARATWEIAEKRSGPAWDALLLSAYERTEHRCCRWPVLDTVRKRGLATEPMLREALLHAPDALLAKRDYAEIRAELRGLRASAAPERALTFARRA